VPSYKSGRRSPRFLQADQQAAAVALIELVAHTAAHPTEEETIAVASAQPQETKASEAAASHGEDGGGEQ